MPSPEVFSERKSSSMMTMGKRNFMGFPFESPSRLPVLSSADLAVKAMPVSKHVPDDCHRQERYPYRTHQKRICLRRLLCDFDKHSAAANVGAPALLGRVVAGRAGAGLAVEPGLPCTARWFDRLVPLSQRGSRGLILLQILFHASFFIGHLHLLRQSSGSTAAARHRSSSHAAALKLGR